MARVFVSYATPDRAIADEVSSWLRAAGHEPFLDGDLRDGISVGEDWKQRLYRELRKVDAVIGVVTSSFVASNWCSAELGIADALGCRLMPVRAETGVVHPLMQDLQYADYQADPQQARDRLLRAVRLLEDGGGTWREGENPFPGLEPFTAALSKVFFGRAAEAREVASRLRVTGGTAGILAIVGPSGCGKSSLLNAAVAPLLDSDPAWLTVPPLVPGNDPVAELAGALASTATRLGLEWSASDVRGRLEAGIDGLRRVAGDLLAARPGPQQRRLLVPIDQAEELFTRATPTVLQGFARLLRAAVPGPVQVVAAMRSEFLDDLRDLPALAGMPIEVYVLAALSQEMLRDVIEQPAKAARLCLENGLSAQLVSDTGSGDALPLLAFTLRQLADGLPAGGTLTLVRYRTLGGVRGALTRHADAALAEAVRTSGLTEREALAGLTRLVTVDETGRRARRRSKLTGLPESLRVALHVFVDRRLLLSDTDDDGQVWLTVAHEALLTGWQPLDTATTDITSALRTARTVEQAAADWNSAGRPAHYLWDAERLTATRATLRIPGRSGNPTALPIVDLDEEALAFLDATARRVHAIRERERRRRTRTSTVLSILLVLALIAAGLAVWQQQAARGAQRTAIAQAMVARADQLRDRDPRVALQLGVAARHFDASPQTHASLRQTLAANPHFFTFYDHAVTGAVFAPDGRTLATTSDDQTIELWDVGNRDRPRQLSQLLSGHDSGVSGAAFAPDGRTLATAGNEDDVILWDVSDRERPRQLGQPPTDHGGGVLDLVFAPDGRTLATASYDTVILWDVSDRARLRPLGQQLTGHTGAVYGVAFAPDGRTLATAGDDGTVRLWDVSDRERPRPLNQPLTGHTGAVYGVAFAPDGRTLATAGVNEKAILWDVSDRERPRPLDQQLTGHTGAVHTVAFTSDGRILATTSEDRTVRLWNVSDRERPELLGQPLIGHAGTVRTAAFAPDGRTLATTSADQTVILWDLSDPRPLGLLGQPLTGHNDSVYGVAFALNGRTLATADDDGTVMLWDVSVRERPRQLSQLIRHPKGVHAVAFAPDGRTLATGSDDETVILWDVSDPGRPRLLGQPLTDHGSVVRAVAFAPDGRTLATAGWETTVKLWDVSDRERARPLSQTLIRHSGSVRAVAFAPDGRTLATAGVDRRVILWDVSDRERPRQLGQLIGYSDEVRAVAFAPDGRALATGSHDGTVRLWDVSDRERPRPLGQPLTGHTKGVTAVTFAQQGRTLVTGSDDETVRLWDLSDRDRALPLGQPLTGHEDGVLTVALSPEGRTLATGSDDQTVRLWELPPLDRFAGDEVREACLRAGGPLDKATWEQYAPGVNYQDTCADR